MSSARPVSDAELDDAVSRWSTHGFAVLRALAPEGACAALRRRIEDRIAGRLPDPGLFFQRDADSGRYADVDFGNGYEGEVAYRKIERLERDDLFLAWLTDPVFGRLAGRILPGAVTLYRAALFGKVAHRGSELPWHQDGGRFWGLDRDPCLQVWTALDDAPREAGCLELLPGSHRWGLASPMGGLVPASAVPADAEARAVAVPVSAGDVVILHNLVWHRSGPNRTARPRRAFSVSYLDGETRCLRTRRAPRSFLPVFPGPG